MIQCPKCGNMNVFQSIAYECRICGTLIPHVKPTARPTNPVAWDNFENTGVVQALVQTIYDAILHPFRFSKNVADKEDFVKAVIFALLIGSATTLITTLLSLRFSHPIFGFSTGDYLSAAKNLIYSPAGMLLRILFTGLYVHMMLYIAGHRSRPLGSTLRIVSYAHAVFFLSILPFFGVFASTVLFLYVLLTSSAFAHKISPVKTAFILVMPLLIFLTFATLSLIFAAGTGLFITDLITELIFSLQ